MPFFSVRLQMSDGDDRSLHHECWPVGMAGMYLSVRQERRQGRDCRVSRNYSGSQPFPTEFESTRLCRGEKSDAALSSWDINHTNGVRVRCDHFMGVDRRWENRGFVATKRSLCDNSSCERSIAPAGG